MMMLICIKLQLNKSEVQFMKKLSNTEAELKNSVAYKKNVYTSLCISVYISVYISSFVVTVEDLIEILQSHGNVAVELFIENKIFVYADEFQSILLDKQK